jgi:hypothetical protein
MPDRLSELALTALAEITPASTVGEEIGRVDEGDGVVSLRFATTLLGYPGWLWTVSISQLEGEEPTVLEAELLPAEGALLAPDWVPWSERLAEWKAAQAAAGEDAPADGSDEDADVDDDVDLDDDDADDDDDESDDDSDEDESDEDDDEPRVLHGGDLDGVDIDELDESDDDDDDEAADDDSDDPDDSAEGDSGDDVFDESER